MNNSIKESMKYPTHCLHDLAGDFAQCVARSVHAKPSVVGPIVLAAMAAGVQAVLDIKTTFKEEIPTSLYFSVIAESGMRKSTVVEHAFYGFREFEAIFNGAQNREESFQSIGAHPYRWEDASESGIVNLFANGAQSAVIVMDEGGMLLKRGLDIPAMCKRYDGSALRVIRKNQITQIPKTRTSFCMTIQDSVFEKLIAGTQGEFMMESGLMARILFSFATKKSFERVSTIHENENPNNHKFHDRIHELMSKYRDILAAGKDREKIEMSAEAREFWMHFCNKWTQEWKLRHEWIERRSFLARAGEHALRIAAVLQWFTEPKNVIDLTYMKSAIELVDWHLNQVLIGFNKPNDADNVEFLASKLESYMQRQYRRHGKGTYRRLELLKNCPVILRKAERLDLAIEALLLAGKLVKLNVVEDDVFTINLTPDVIPDNSLPSFDKNRCLSSFLRRDIDAY